LCVNGRYPPEFVPPSKDAATAGNFDAEFTLERAVDSVVNLKVRGPSQRHRFEPVGFILALEYI
jgi:hypothetical protein